MDKYPPIDNATIAPLTLDGVPDLYNQLPSRIVSLEEAKVRAWPTFYDTSTCRYGHQAPRYVSNPRLCVDCHRIKNGRTPIGAKTGGTPDYRRAYKQRELTPTVPTVMAAITPLEPDSQEKRFLVSYADFKEVGAAAKAVGLTAAQIYARMSWSAVFKDAVNKLEDDLSIKKSFPASPVFQWTPEKRNRLVEVYIDTGDIAAARDAIVLTPSEFHKEIERNLDFANQLDLAGPLAVKALEERAIQLALAGNDKLLTKIMTAKIPEYKERVSVDMNVTEKLDDRQLDARLGRLFTKFRGRIGDIIDAELIEPESPGQVAALTYVGGDGPQGKPQSNQDLL